MWRLFEETSRQFREQSAETDRKFREQSVETDRKFRERSAETDRILKERSAETDRILKERSAEMDRVLKETSLKVQETTAQVQETTAQMRETDRVVKEVSRKVGSLGSRWGDFVEGLVAPACETLFAERGIPVHKVSRQMKAKLPGGRHMEIDVFVVNTDAVVLVEVKSALTVEDVRDHLIRLAEFKDFFPEYANKRVFGAVAGIVIGEHADRFAMNKGLFVIVQSGDTVRMANEPEFQPHPW
ncbi:MAG: DUF3782 domain-containing protein [Nitrospirae bacterium]|nr:DUF3782 domain-containing protein [Magnetococcales bacterium]HAT49584.1 DUF3782 domain-containing protein [Alphaproteobacteria bacterium]